MPKREKLMDYIYSYYLTYLFYKKKTKQATVFKNLWPNESSYDLLPFIIISRRISLRHYLWSNAYLIITSNIINHERGLTHCQAQVELSLALCRIHQRLRLLLWWILSLFYSLRNAQGHCSNQVIHEVNCQQSITF